MTLLALPNLYCSAADIQDYLSSEGVDMRLDDHSQATGQTIIVNNPGNIGDTTLQVAAVEQVLPNGAVLNFDGAGTPAVVQVILSALAQVGATTINVMPLLAALPLNASAIDNGVNAATFARVLKARIYATARIKRYCTSRYNDSDLARCNSVNEWATYIAARWLCKRRAQGCPAGIEQDFEDTMEELKKVKTRNLDLEDVPTRTSAWPAWSNVGIDLTYDNHRVRVEQSMSEPTPTQYSQYIDWWDTFNYEW